MSRNDAQFPRRTAKKMPPLRTASEMAEEFGMRSAQQLAGVMQASPVKPPEPIRRLRNRTTHTTWYDPREMRAWWKAHCAAMAARRAA